MGHDCISCNHHFIDIVTVDPGRIRCCGEGSVDTFDSKCLEFLEPSPFCIVDPGEDILAAADLTVVIGTGPHDTAVNQGPDIYHDGRCSKVDCCPVAVGRGVSFLNVDHPVSPGHQGNGCGDPPAALPEHLRYLPDHLKRGIDGSLFRAAALLNPPEQAGEVR